jgi:hypothetical protein
MTQKMDHCHTQRCFPLLELLTSLPELVHMWCPPERGVLLVNTSRDFWGILDADVRPLYAMRFKTYDKEKWGNYHDGSGFVHGMGLAEALEPLLAKLKGVRTLDLCGMGLGNTGALVLACILGKHRTNIEVLDLGYNSLGEETPVPETVQYQTQIPGVVKRIKPVLKFLDENASPRDVLGIEALVDVLIAQNTVKKAIFTLNGFENSGISHLLRLVRNTKLRDLDVSSNTLNNVSAMVPEICTTLSQSSLKRFAMYFQWSKHSTPVIMSLMTNKTLEVFEVGVRYDEREIIEVLTQFLAENTTLKTLNIGYVTRGGQPIRVQDVQQRLSRPVLATGS